MVDQVFGLGALPDIPDERDYPVSALYAAEGIVASVVLPASYTARWMPAVLNQGDTPQCVAFSSSSLKAWHDRRDQERWFDFDEGLFFREIGGTSSGAYVRSAMERMRVHGYPVKSVGDPQHHRIVAYYSVPRDLATIKAAIYDLGPIVVTTPWYKSWFRPVAGVLPAPDVFVGYHAIVAYGWGAKGLLLRNSWGTNWGKSGDCWMPNWLVPRLDSATKTVDAIEHPIPFAHVVEVTARPSLRARRLPSTSSPVTMPNLAFGRDVNTLALEKFGGKYSANGTTRNDWLQVKVGVKIGWIARGFTRLVR